MITTTSVWLGTERWVGKANNLLSLLWMLFKARNMRQCAWIRGAGIWIGSMGIGMSGWWFA